MAEWTTPPHQHQLKNQSTLKFGYDDTGLVEYKFNSLGFRSPEISDVPTLFSVGNSISFGIGIDERQTFTYLVSQQMHRPYANLSFGCYWHENHDHLTNLTRLSKRDNDDIFLIQVNNLDRRRNGDTVTDGNDAEFCTQRFLDYFEKVSVLFKHKTHVFLYWDEIDHVLPKSVTKQILIYNKGHLDQSIPDMSGTFGTRSHNFISKVLVQALKKVD